MKKVSFSCSCWCVVMCDKTHSFPFLHPSIYKGSNFLFRNVALMVCFSTAVHFIQSLDWITLDKARHGHEFIQIGHDTLMRHFTISIKMNLTGYMPPMKKGISTGIHPWKWKLKQEGLKEKSEFHMNSNKNSTQRYCCYKAWNKLINRDIYMHVCMYICMYLKI